MKNLSTEAKKQRQGKSVKVKVKLMGYGKNKQF